MTEMTDQELADYCAPGDPRQLELVSKLSDSERKVLNVMSDFAFKLKLWNEGLGPRPATGVIMCGPKQIRGAGKE